MTGDVAVIGYITRKQFAHVLQQAESARMSPADLRACMDFFDVKGMYVCMYVAVYSNEYLYVAILPHTNIQLTYTYIHTYFTYIDAYIHT